MSEKDKELSKLLIQLKSISLGVHPITGEALPSQSIINDPKMIRAVIRLKDELEQTFSSPKSRDKRPTSAEKRHKNTLNNLPVRHGEKWSDKEIFELVESFKNGISPKLIAKKHDRKVTAIIARLQQENVIDQDEAESYL